MNWKKEINCLCLLFLEKKKHKDSIEKILKLNIFNKFVVYNVNIEINFIFINEKYIRNWNF